MPLGRCDIPQEKQKREPNQMKEKWKWRVEEELFIGQMEAVTGER